MKNFDACVKYRPCTDCVIISCKLGLWSIKGPYDLTTAKQAEEKYIQFRDLGKYKKLLTKENPSGSIKIK